MTDNFEKDINVPSKEVITKLHGNRKDLTGMKVGKLTCLKPIKTSKNKNSEWLCECECGNLKIAQTYRLLSGRLQSCGDCYHTTNYYIPMIKELEKQLKNKEKECDRWQDLAEHNGRVCNVRLDKIDELEHDNNDLLEQLKANNEELKKIIKRLDVPKHEVIDMDIALENEKLKQTLTEIKPILEFYANSKMGEEQLDGTYKITLSSGYIMIYDPKPAKKALQKISEVDDANV